MVSTLQLNSTAKETTCCIRQSTCIDKLVKGSINCCIQGAKKYTKTQVINATIWTRDKGELSIILFSSNTKNRLSISAIRDGIVKISSNNSIYLLRIFSNSDDIRFCVSIAVQ